MHIYDTHAHLDHIENLAEAMAAAEEANVKGIISPGMDLASCEKLPVIKAKFPRPEVYYAFGMHPSEANEDDLGKIEKAIRENAESLVAVGEIGLDFWYKWVRKDDEKKNEQRKVFRRLLSLAKELDLPAIIHSRGCWRECFETAQELGVKRAEFHWYSGPVDVLKDIIGAGYFVSTSPSVAFSPHSREAMAAAPVEQTLIETDSPVYYNDRETGEGFRAGPKHVWNTLKAYAQLKNLDEADALARLNANAEAFFQL